MRAAIVLFLYAAGLLGAGVVAYMLAPEGANAKTALIVPGACAALIALLGAGVAATGGKATRVLHVAALVLTLLFAAAFSQRAMAASEAAREHRNARIQLEQAIEAGEVADTPEARAAYYEREDAPDHSKAYLANTLWALVVLSVLVFVAGIVTHPRPARQPAGGNDSPS